MARFKYFTLAEFLRSDTAAAQHIDNTPSFDVVEHLAALTEKILDPLRAAYGQPIRVTSGYRCERLNSAVGGVPGSAHIRGDAADLQANDMKAFKAFVVEWLQKTHTRFDQYIVEKSGKTEWVHISLQNGYGVQRGEIKMMNV